ncbi:MAG TPA: galactose-1-phosphate uridylyltransferase [Micromonosporaceae bacterium]|jgi:UDPglucose--hexose-1-phosphate uridylyltransferase|nr:galactose-1-phosphate uridylyltransferase [Micromonosporaceae bacterium]
MHRSSTVLADGREIIYYDRATVRAALPPDRRELPPQTAVSRVRYDAPTGDWVVVAGHRQTRLFSPGANDCPLCPSRDGHPTEVPAESYEVVVFENRFSALAPAADEPDTSDTGELLRSARATGRCEVICFCSDHDTTFAELKADHVRLILDAWTDRTRTLAAMPGVAQVFCFENRGPEMGVSQPHPHGQIYAYPFVTPRTARMIDRATAYRRDRGTNLFEDLLAAEIADGRRIVRATDEWVAFVPYAAKWPYEVHLYPRRRRLDLTELDEPQCDAFPGIYLDMLQRFERLFDTPTPYVSAWHQAPATDGRDELALHVELFTNRRSSERLKVLGGTEVAMDAFSNDVGPEEAAARLRDLGD